MTREYLESLGLEKEVIDKIMAEHGKGIEKVKADVEAKETEVETLQGQLKTANEKIEEFEKVDVEEVQKAAKDYKKKFEEAEKESAKKIAQLEFEHEIENAIRDSKARNVTAVKALLDIDSLKESNNRLDDIKKALEATKEANDYLFEDDEASGTGGSLGAGEKRRETVTKADILAMDDPIERKRKIAENIELFN